MPRDRLWRRAVMAPSEVPQLARAAVEPQALPTKLMTEGPAAQPGFGRNFGFLVHDGSRLIKRRSHPTDRRVRTLWLTPAAIPVVTQILAINRAIREEAFAGMAAQARDIVIDILDGIKDNLALR